MSTETNNLYLKKPEITDNIENTLNDLGDNFDLLDAAVDNINISTEKLSNKGINNGYAGLDAGGKVPLIHLPSTLLVYKGIWNATTNTPELSSPDISKAGHVYNVSVGGTRFGYTFSLGDWAIYNDQGVIEKSDNSDDVVSVNGQQGVVILNTSHIDDTLDRRYVTDVEKVLLSNTSGVNSGDQDLSGLLSLDQTVPQTTIGIFVFPKLGINTTPDSSTQAIISSSGATIKSLVVRGYADQTANLQEWQDSTGAVKSYISRSGAIWAPYLNNISNSGNAAIQMSDAGTIITRNVSDTNPSLIINNILGTGKILDLQAGGTSKSFFDINGQLGIQGIYYPSSSIYAYIKPTSTGTIISRNVADGKYMFNY